jgi:hypothetical protein
MSALNFVTLRLLVGEAQDLLSASPAAKDWNARAVAALAAAAEAGTPAAQWRATGEPDPHAGRYDGERAALCMGDLTDDELANEAFLNYDERPSIGKLLDGTAHAPIAWMTAVRDRIRWLSRALERELANRTAAPIAQPLAEAEQQAEPTVSPKPWTNSPMNPWVPTLTAHQARRAGKTTEEVGELGAVLGRLQIQDLHAIDPSSGKTNFERLWEESADVEAQTQCNRKAFGFPEAEYRERVARKVAQMGEWEAHYLGAPDAQPTPRVPGSMVSPPDPAKLDALEAMVEAAAGAPLLSEPAQAESSVEQQALMWRLHKFLDVAAGEGLELDGVDAANLYCDIFDTGVEVEQRTAAAALPALAYAPTGFASFKNFHRSLCDRFGYRHDHAFWWRDLVSLQEWIANRPLLAQLSPEQVDAIVAAGSFRNAAGGIYEASIYSFARDCVDAARPVGISAAARDVLAERARCISAEGWTPEHDDEHDAGELAAAAAAYAIAAADALHPLSQGDGGFADEPPLMWPWAREWWKPGPPRRMLEKAGQLTLAQMECIDRAAAREAQP